MTSVYWVSREVRSALQRLDAGKELRRLLKPSLLTNPKWMREKTNLVLNAEALGAAKGLVTSKEAEYLMMGPPKGVPLQHWVCCFTPCKKPIYQEVDFFHTEVLKYLCFGFGEDYQEHENRTRDYLNHVERHRDVLFAPKVAKNPENVYVPTMLVPVRLLPSNYQKRILSACGLSKSIVHDLFVCPHHFKLFAEELQEGSGSDDSQDGANKQKRHKQTNSGPKSKGINFSFHGLMCQLVFKPWNCDILAGAPVANPAVDAFKAELKEYWSKGLKSRETSFRSRPFERFESSVGAVDIKNCFGLNPLVRPKVQGLSLTFFENGEEITEIGKPKYKHIVPPLSKSQEDGMKKMFEERIRRVIKNKNTISNWCLQNGKRDPFSFTSCHETYQWLRKFHFFLSGSTSGCDENLLVLTPEEEASGMYPTLQDTLKIFDIDLDLENQHYVFKWDEFAGRKTQPNYKEKNKKWKGKKRQKQKRQTDR